ncbi:MAG: hypothetical protein ACK47B_21820 [Armatimonadota bacterium]
MPYATAADVQESVPLQSWTMGADSQPSQATIEEWLEAQSAWVDATLRWKYDVPITAAADLALLKPLVAMLVAAQVWAILGGHTGQEPVAAVTLRRTALSMLVFDPKSGQSRVVLPNSAESETGEAELGQPISSFSDPESDDGIPRLFEIGTDAW